MGPFWSAASSLPIVAEDAEKIASRSLVPRESVLLRDPRGILPEVWIARAIELGPPGQIHLDLLGDAELGSRLTSLGATVVRETSRFTVLTDPEGNEFCLLTRP